MTDHDPEPETIDDDLADEAGELILEAEEQYQQNQAEHDAFLETVAEEEGAEVLETDVNLIGDYTVPLKAKLNGDLMDRMGHMDARMERFEEGEARGYEISETADEISQLLDDLIEDKEWHKAKFYAAYESEGLDPLGAMLENCFKALKEERERREGVADGFRQK
jgi:hypothetical protein